MISLYFLLVYKEFRHRSLPGAENFQVERRGKLYIYKGISIEFSQLSMYKGCKYRFSGVYVQHRRGISRNSPDPIWEKGV